jgi:hypothetical protein
VHDAALRETRVVPLHVRVAQARRLEAPCAPKLRGHGARVKVRERLAEARGRRVGVGADPYVVAANVLCEEVLVKDGT